MVLALSIILLASVAQAGNDRGGGAGVLCPEKVGAPGTVRLLDFVQWESSYPPRLPKTARTVMEKVDSVLARMSKVDPARGERYRAVASTFFKDVEWVAQLSSTQDFGYVKIPEGCSLVQLAEQFGDPYMPVPSIRIARPLWDRMSDDDRAGLVLHEIIYQELRQIGLRNSIQLREFVAWLVNHASDELDTGEYLQSSMEAGLMGNSAKATPDEMREFKSCLPTWNYDSSQMTVCAWHRYDLDFADSITNPCHFFVQVLASVMYGSLDNLVQRSGTVTYLATGDPGQVVLQMLMNYGPGPALSAANLVLNVRDCSTTR